MDLQIDTNSKNHIDAIVNKGKEDVWRLTRFMENPSRTKDLNHGIYYSNSITVLIFQGVCGGL